jgi:hypothetical protein
MSARKLVGIVFWDSKGMLMVGILATDHNVINVKR